MQNSRRAYWIEVGVLSLLSIIAYRLGMIRAAAFRPGLLLAFLLPVQLCWVRRGERAGLIASALVVGAIGVWDAVDFVRLRRLSEGAEGLGLVFLDIVPVVVFVAGLYLLNAPGLVVRVSGEERRLTVVQRMIAALAVVVAVYVPAGLLLNLSGEFDSVGSEVAEMVEYSLPMLEISEGEVMDLVAGAVRMTLSAFLAGFFVTLVGNWWLGTRIALGSRLGAAAENPVAERLRALSVSSFRLPAGNVWLVVGALGGIVLSLLTELGWVSYVIWNVALIVLALYAIQGMGVARHLLDRRGLSRRRRIGGLVVALALGLFVPGMDFMFVLGMSVSLVGLAGLGISEVWVNYHRFERSGEEQ